MRDYSQYSEQELIEIYKSDNDLEAFGELFKRSQHIVLGVCMKYLRDLSAAEDALMEIFEELIVALRKAEVRNFKPWLGTVARNFLHRKYHRESKLRTVSFEEQQPGSDSGFMEFAEDGTPIDDLAELEMQEDRLRSAVELLKPGQQECIRYFYLQQKSYSETCQLTGYTFKQVKSHIQNGKRNLKIILEGQT